ncbi:2'-5'-oligoadenylate synthase 1, partial [Ophiophagus hannah]
ELDYPVGKEDPDAKSPGEKYIIIRKGVLGGVLGTSMKNGKMDLQLLSNIVNLYREQEKDRKEVTEAIAEWLKKWQKLRVSRTTKVLPLFHSISKLHGNKLKMYIEETAGRIKGWWKQPYLSDADLELLSKVFKSYTDEEKDWKVIDRIAEQFKKLPVEITDGILDLIKNYTDKEKDRKKIIKMTKRQVSSRQEKPYLSDADLVLFLNVFKSYTDQENSRKMIIEEIERRLKEWQQEAYLPEVDVELLLEFLKSYRDQKKDWKEITQKIETWVSECGKQLHLSEDERAFLNDLIKRKKEMDQMIIKEIARWRSEHQGEPYLSAADLGSLLDLIKRYRYHDKNQHLITEVISGCYSANQRLNQEDNRRVLLDLLKSYKKQEKDLKETTQEIEMWLHECKKKLYVSEAGLVPFRKLSERYLEEEKDQRMLTEEIARWRKAGQGERDLSDADLGLLLELTKRYTDKEEQQKRITEDIVRWFSECKDNMHLEIIFEKSKWPNPRVLQFKLRSKRSVDFIDFDVLPAYDALGKSGEFSACFTELQRDFIKGRPTKLKSLIRLVKHWYNEVCCLEN